MFQLFQKKKVKQDDSKEKLKEQVYNTMYPSPCSSYDPNKWLQNVNDMSYLSQSLEQDIDKILRISLPKSKKPTPRNSIEPFPEKSPPRNVEQKKKTWYVQQQIEKKQECSKLQINMNSIICEFPIQNIPNSSHEEPQTPTGSKQFMAAVLSKIKERSMSKEKDYLFQDQKSLAQNFKQQEFQNKNENFGFQQSIASYEEKVKPNKKIQNAKKTNPPQNQSNPPQTMIATKPMNPKQNEPLNKEKQLECLPSRQDIPKPKKIESKSQTQEINPIYQEKLQKNKIREEPIRQENPYINKPTFKRESLSIISEKPANLTDPQDDLTDQDVCPPKNKTTPNANNNAKAKKKNSRKAKPKERIKPQPSTTDIIQEKTKQISKGQNLEPVIFNVNQQWGRMKLRIQARKLEIASTQQFKDLLLSINGFHLHPSEGELRVDDLRPMQNQKGKYFQSFELWINPYVLIGPLKIQNQVKLHIRFKKGYSGEVFCDETLKETIPTNQADGKTLQKKLILANNTDHVIKLVCCLVNITPKRQK